MDVSARGSSFLAPGPPRLDGASSLLLLLAVCSWGAWVEGFGQVGQD